ncbi:MAG TPA: PAS domain S-box protein [Caulobacteraceae bacterium]|nr:PAS domain S-box protein [Caulobacteraceae bacterium]
MRLGTARSIADVVWAGFVVGVLAWLSLVLIRDGRVAAVWPANAVIVARLTRASPRRWGAYMAAGLIGNLYADFAVGDAPPAAGVLALCNSIEILLCSLAIRGLVGPRLDLARPRHLAAYVVSAVGAAAFSAIGGATWLVFHAHARFWGAFSQWTLADALGLLVVAPALMALNRPDIRRFFAREHLARNLALLAGVVAIAVLVTLEHRHELRYLVFVILMAIAYKGEKAGAALGLLVAGAAFMATTILDPAARGHDPMASAFLVQTFMLAGAVVAFPVAGLMARRRELEASLAETARDFKVLAENAKDVIVRTDRAGRIVYISPSVRQFGHDPSDVIGRGFEELTHPDELSAVRESFARIMRGECVPDGQAEHHIVTAAGEWLWAEGAPRVLYGPDGKPSGVLTQLRDVTARKAAQQALTESEARYRLLADLATDIILRLDARGIIRYISPACRQLGYEPEEMVGRPATDFLHPDDRAMATTRSAALLAGEPRAPEQRTEYRAITKGGECLWLEGASALACDEAGELTDIVSHLRDVTERRAFEDELRRKRAEAEAATLAKSEFLANMSHEIRTPLTGILGFAGLLEGLDGLPPEAATYASRITTASRTLLSVVNDILDFSKIEAGQVELDPQPFDPAAFVRETIELVSAQAEERKLSLHTAIDGPLPAAVLADAARLRQILLNLLGNAIKFTDLGGVTVTLAHDAADGGQLRFSVTDTGVGIAPEQLHRLFQRFSQADGSINRQYGGTGLGLAICKSLTALMGGDIGVESRPGQGATFWFTVRAPAAERAQAPVGDGAGAFDARPARILIVDDSPVNRELVTALLGVFGHDLSEACGGAEAVEASARQPFDLILMDLQMPGMDGLAATEAIRAGDGPNRATPIVALSANILPAHLEACRRVGMNDHIGKPIDTRELLTKVMRWTAEGHDALAAGPAEAAG